MKPKVASQPKRGGKGFRHAAGFVARDIREAAESRGFAVSRVVTHWADIAGADIASIARPVEVSYARGGFGATLTLLTTGAQAPMLEMQKETLRERVNRCYGYNAIARIRITQTAPEGFSDGRLAFETAPSKRVPDQPSEKVKTLAAQSAAPVENSDLRRALTQLGENVLKRTTT